MKFQNNFKLVTETCSQGRLSEISEMFSLERETVLYEDFFKYIFRAAYDTSAPNAKRKYPDEGEADEEEIEEYKVIEKGKSYSSSGAHVSLRDLRVCINECNVYRYFKIYAPYWHLPCLLLERSKRGDIDT